MAEEVAYSPETYQKWLTWRYRFYETKDLRHYMAQHGGTQEARHALAELKRRERK